MEDIDHWTLTQITTDRYINACNSAINNDRETINISFESQ